MYAKNIFKYRSIIMNGIILLALVIALILKDGNAKDFFLGVGTGAALVVFGQSITSVKAKENNKYINVAEHKN